MASRSSSLEEHQRKFEDPARLAKTLVIERDGVVIGDLMLAIEDGWDSRHAPAKTDTEIDAVFAEITARLGSATAVRNPALRTRAEITSFSGVGSATVLLWRSWWTRWRDGMRCCVRI